MSLMVLSPTHDTPRALPWRISKFQRRIAFAQLCHTWSSCPVMSHLEHMSSHVTPGALAQSCHFFNSCPVMTLLDLLLSLVTAGSFAQSCQSWISSRGISKFQVRISFTQLCHSCSTCTVMSLLELSPCHVTPGALAYSCNSWRSWRVMTLLELPLVVPAVGYICRRGNKGTDKNQQLRKIHRGQLRCG